MAAIPTRYSVGNQARRIVAAFDERSRPVSAFHVSNQAEDIARAFAVQSMAGGYGLPRAAPANGGGLGAWYDQLLSGGMDFLQSRWGTPPGTVVQTTPQGQVIYRQPEGSTVTLPVIPGPLSTQQYGVAAPEGFSTGMAIALGVGVLALVMVMRGGRR